MLSKVYEQEGDTIMFSVKAASEGFLSARIDLSPCFI